MYRSESTHGRSTPYIGAVLLAGVLLAATLVAGATAPASALLLKPPHPALGRAATTSQISAWDIDVRPDGVGLPEGRGSVAEGEAVYEKHCAACHGTFGDSQEYVQLAGGIGSLKTTAPQRTVGSKLDTPTTLFDYINRAMPFPNSKLLTPSEVYAVSAFILNLNDILPADAVLDKQSLPKVQMPNRDGYTTDHGFMRVDGKPDTHNTACMRNCETEIKLTSELPKDFTRQFFGDISDNFRDYRPEARVAQVVSPASAPVDSWQAQESLTRNQCALCHAADRKVVGPAFREVAARYAKRSDAAAYLHGKVKAGGAGVWGVIPMPPQSAVADDELDKLVKWILEQR